MRKSLKWAIAISIIILSILYKEYAAMILLIGFGFFFGKSKIKY